MGEEDDVREAGQRLGDGRLTLVNVEPRRKDPAFLKGFDQGLLIDDWTAGCIAVTDEEIEELYRVTPDWTPIEIRP